MTSRMNFHRHSFSNSGSSLSPAPGPTLVAPRPSKVASQAATALIGKLADIAQDTLNKPSAQKLLNRIPSPVANIFKDDPETGPSVLDHFASLLPAKLADNLIGLQGITRILSSIVRTTAAIFSWRRPHIERLIKEAKRNGHGREIPYFSPHPPPVAMLAMAIWTLVCFHPMFLLASFPLWTIALVPTAPADLRTPRTPGSGTLRRHGMNRNATDESTSDDGYSQSDNDDDLIAPPPHLPLAPALPPRSQSDSLPSSHESTIDQPSQSYFSQSEPNLAAPPLPPRPSESISHSTSSTSLSDTQHVTPHPRTSSVNSLHLRISSQQSVSSCTSTSSTLDPSFDPNCLTPMQPSPSTPAASTKSATLSGASDRPRSPSPSKRATRGPATQAVHDLLEIQSIILSSADRIRHLLAILGFDDSITRWASTVAKPPPEDMPALNSKKEQTKNELIGQGVPVALSLGALAGWFLIAWIGLLIPAVWAGGMAAMVVFSDLGLFYMALVVPRVRESAGALVRALRGWWVDLRLRWAGLWHAAGYEPPKTKVGKLVHALTMEIGAIVSAASRAWVHHVLFWWANLAFDLRRVVVGREGCDVVDDENEEQEMRRLFAADDAGNELDSSAAPGGDTGGQ